MVERFALWGIAGLTVTDNIEIRMKIEDKARTRKVKGTGVPKQTSRKSRAGVS